MKGRKETKLAPVTDLPLGCLLTVGWYHGAADSASVKEFLLVAVQVRREGGNGPKLPSALCVVAHAYVIEPGGK